MADRSAIDGVVARRRRYTYFAVFAFGLVACLCIRDSTWRGDVQLHTLIETVATVLALAAGCLALVRYHSKKDNTFLLIGTAFAATGFLDAYHAVVSSAHFVATFPSSPPALFAWSWFASRIFLSLLLWLSWLLWRREDRLGAQGLVSERVLYGGVAGAAFASLALVQFVPMPVTYYLPLYFPRAQEFLPGLFLALALAGYLRKGKWKTDSFEHWLVLSLILGLMSQVLFMPLSGQLYDAMFDAAHLLKVGSYLCALAGLLFGMRHLFSESFAQQELAFTNAILATEQEASPDAILVVDERARIISYNRRFVDLWGLTQEMVSARADEPVLRSVVEQVQDRAAFLDRIQYLYAHRTEESHEEIGLKDGRILDRYSAPMIADNGKYYGRVWFFRNITKRKRAEQAVIEERTFSDTLIASLPDGIAVFDSSGRLVRWNDKLSGMLGLSDERMAALDALETIHVADRSAVREKIRQAFQQGAATVEARMITKAGIRDFSLRATRADTTDGAYLVGVATDVTERRQAEEMLRRNDAHLAEAQRISHVGSWEFDHATHEGSWTVEAFRIFERDPESFTPSFEGLLSVVHPDDRDSLSEQFGRALRERVPFETEHRLLMRDGRVKYVRERCSTSFDGSGRPLRTLGTMQDITEQINSDRQIKLFRVLIDNAADQIAVVDPATLRIIDANESTCVKLGYTREELLALRADIDISGPEAFAAVAERLRSDGIHTFETNYKRKDGVTFPAETTIRNIVLDRRYCVIVARDITERKRAEEEVHELQAQLRDQAVHDPLTGLFNRRYLDEELGRELIRATRSGRPVGMIMCDIDHFKAVNDTHGHLVGDQVLRAFAELLRSQTRGSDIVCRYGGEEVLLLLPDASRDATYQRAEQLRMALAAQPIPVGELAVPVTASFGVAVMPKNGATSDELIRAADEAMYAAKQAGRNRVVVAPARKGPSLAAWRAPDRALCADRFAGARYPVSDPSRRLHRLRPRREY